MLQTQKYSCELSKMEMEVKKYTHLVRMNAIKTIFCCVLRHVNDGKHRQHQR